MLLICAIHFLPELSFFGPQIILGAFLREGIFVTKNKLYLSRPFQAALLI